MKFRTELALKDSEVKIEPSDQIFCIGSCFSMEISERLSAAQLQTFCNPFGTLFNPVSIKNALQKLHDCAYYKHDDLIFSDGIYLSTDHSTAFDTPFAHKTLEAINGKIDAGNEFLQNSKFVIITLGTSLVHELIPKNKIVANCHKIPTKFFNKRFLTHDEICKSLRTSIQLLKDICAEDVQIIYTVSPVRHTRDGIVENSFSKAKLLTAVHEVIPEFSNCNYLPIFEVMNDDLRDYRFYKDDLIHPNNQAINYIFEKFGNAYFSDETMSFVEENLKIYRDLQHIPSDTESESYKNFRRKINEKIAVQQAKVKHPIFKK